MWKEISDSDMMNISLIGSLKLLKNSVKFGENSQGCDWRYGVLGAVSNICEKEEVSEMVFRCINSIEGNIEDKELLTIIYNNDYDLLT